MTTTDNINYIADEGKVFICKADGVIMGWGLGLGTSDSINNYEEIDCPAEYKGMEGYDNTMNKENNIVDLPTNPGGVVS